MADAPATIGGPDPRWFPKPWQTVEAIIDWPLASWSGDRSALAALAEARAQDDIARERARLLARPDTAVVVAGQQPALGGGPCYSLAKAAHAVALADACTAAGQPTVAVFWSAGEDHDHGEANHADLLHRDGRLQRIRTAYPRPAAALHHQPASHGWEALCAALDDLEGPTAGRPWVLAMGPQPDEDLGAWHARCMATAFAGSGLVVLESRDLRPLYRPTALRSLDAWPAASLAERRQNLIAAGHGDPFGPLDGAPWFDDQAEARRPLGPGQAAALLASHPDRCSPGAALRPLLQQAALPAMAAILGPGEMAYHAAIVPAYAALGTLMPAMVPRWRCGLLHPAVKRGLERWDLDPESCAPAAPLPAAPACDGVDLRALDAALDRLAAASTDTDTARRIATGIERLRRERHRLATSLSRGARHAAGLPAPGALRDWCHPRGRPQERSMSMLQALWQGGPGLPQRMIAAVGPHPPTSTTWLDL